MTARRKSPEFPARVVLGEGYVVPREKSVALSTDTVGDDQIRLCIPDALGYASAPRYRLILERIDPPAKPRRKRAGGGR